MMMSVGAPQCADAVKSSVVSGKVGWLLCFIVTTSVVRGSEKKERAPIYSSVFENASYASSSLRVDKRLQVVCLLGRESHPFFMC